MLKIDQVPCPFYYSSEWYKVTFHFYCITECYGLAVVCPLKCLHIVSLVPRVVVLSGRVKTLRAGSLWEVLTSAEGATLKTPVAVSHGTLVGSHKRVIIKPPTL